MDVTITITKLIFTVYIMIGILNVLVSCVYAFKLNSGFLRTVKITNMCTRNANKIMHLGIPHSTCRPLCIE